MTLGREFNSSLSGLFGRGEDMNNIFITGMLRSGTTLVEKLLHGHPELSIASQPSPLFYIEMKRKYLKGIRADSRYPLGNQFRSEDLRSENFYRFLDTEFIERQDLLSVFSEMKKYSGQSTKSLLSDRYIGSLNSGKFMEVYKQLMKFIEELYFKMRLRYSGSKEVICEEFLPYILSRSNESKGIIVIRDPRDVLTSLGFGEYEKWVGKKRPILFDLRNWRKSVAFAIYLESSSDRYQTVKYEDLVEDPINVLNKIASFLNIRKFEEELYIHGIKDQSGDLWSGNSSFGGKQCIVQADSVKKYSTLMDAETIKYVESICYPEMVYLDYEFDMIQEFDEKNIRNYCESPKGIREVFCAELSHSKQYVEEEIERYKNLQSSLQRHEANTWFLFEEVYERFRESLLK